jgi:uncharacterized membrane protein
MSSITEPNDRRLILGLLKGLAVVLAVVAYQALVHWAMTEGRIDGPGRVLAIATVLAAAVWLVLLAARAGRPLVAALLAVAAAALVWTLWASRPALLYFIPHVAAYLFLLGLFGRTLLPRREALITTIARHVHGELPDFIEAYTRRVTWAWSLFFGGMALTSILLYAFAPLAAWSFFANLMNLPLIAAMFVCEYVYRIVRYPDFSHATLLTTVRAFWKFHA